MRSFGKGRRGLVLRQRVRPRGVEILHPCGDGAAGVAEAEAEAEAEEQALVQKLVTHPAVEALELAVLHRLSRRDVMALDAMILRLGEDGVLRELRAVIGNDHVRLAATADHIGQLRCH